MSGGALWKGVFLADLTDPSAPRISLAREGLLVSQGPDTLDLHLIDGSTHETPTPRIRTSTRFPLFRPPTFRSRFRRHRALRTTNPRRCTR